MSNKPIRRNQTDLAPDKDQRQLIEAMEAASDHSERLQEAADAVRFMRFNQSKAVNTLIAYCRDLQLFAETWLGANAPPNAGELLTLDPALWEYITHGEVEAFIHWMEREGYALTSINRALYAIRSYARLALLSGLMDNMQYAKIEGIAGRRGKEAQNVDDHRAHAGKPIRRSAVKPDAAIKKADSTKIPADILDKLRHDHDLATLYGLRAALIANVLLELGLRASELAGLQWGNVDLERGEIYFYRPKVGKWQTMGLSKGLQAILRRYMATFPHPSETADEAGRDNKRLLWSLSRWERVTVNGLSPAAVSMVVKRLGQRHDLPGLSAHDLRHHWTTAQHRRKVDTLRLQRMGGWKGPQMLELYIEEYERVNEGYETPYED